MEPEIRAAHPEDVARFAVGFCLYESVSVYESMRRWRTRCLFLVGCVYGCVAWTNHRVCWCVKNGLSAARMAVLCGNRGTAVRAAVVLY